MSKHPAFPGSIVFLLGCQRSGTTWLANIFDASPDTLLFMEPFSPPYGIFPEFPGVWEYFDESTPALDRLLCEDMPARLMRYKSLVSPESIADPSRFRRERSIARRARRFAPPPLRRRIRKFELLNLNRLDDDYPLYPKSTAPALAAVKELRFAGKVPVLRHAFPQASFVVIMRHPAATVHSILGWFARGRLVELRADLDHFLDALEAQPVGEEYRGHIARCRGGGLADTVALYWRVSYETMFRRLEGDSRAQLLVYERLASRPRETAVEMFERLQTPWAPSLDDYLERSTHAGLETSSPIDTRRESATYYRSWVGRLAPDVEAAVRATTEGSFLLPHFEPYYS